MIRNETMRGPDDRGWVQELVTIAALVIVIAFAGVSWTRGQRANELLQLTTRGYEIHDRLTGTRMDFSSVDPQWRDRPAPTVVWILDLERCSGCFDTVTDWTYLEQLADHDFVLYAAGSPTLDVLRRLRMLERTRIIGVSSAELRGLMGAVLPNTKLLLDQDGTVLMVDSRDAGQECGWSFEAQLAALRGLDAARPTRSRAPSAADTSAAE